MATVVTFNIAGATATWDSQAAGANLVFAADKEDTGTERTVDEASEYACEVWANSVDTAFDQINEAFNGTRTLTALAVGGAVESDAGLYDDVVVGDTGDASSHGITILSGSSYFCGIAFGDDSDNDVGQIQYRHSLNRFDFYAGATLVQVINSTEVAPNANDTFSSGTSSARWSTVYGVDGDFSDDVTVGGFLTLDGSFVTGASLTIEDTAAATTFRNNSTDATAKAIRWGLQHYTNAEQDNCIAYATNSASAGVLFLGGGTSSYNAMTDIRFYTAADTTTTTGDITFRIQNGITTAYDPIEFGAGGPTLQSGSGSPESAVTADVGSIYMRTDGGASTSIYVKESGTGNTGWVAK